MATEVRPPSRREVLGSAAITVAICAGVGLAATALIGSVGVFVDIALTDKTADASTQTGLPPWLVDLMFVLVVLVVWPAVSRLGHGTPGYGVVELKSFDLAGEPLRRGRVWLITGIPLLVLVLAELAGHPAAGLAVLVAAWAPCLLRHDRRTTLDLLLGVRPHSTATPRTATPHPWAVREQPGSDGR